MCTQNRWMGELLLDVTHISDDGDPIPLYGNSLFQFYLASSITPLWSLIYVTVTDPNGDVRQPIMVKNNSRFMNSCYFVMDS